ncbi:pyrroloquinoline quinone biosynthesis protein PqqB [Paenibacillus sp. XY044]|uniref:pyrroloquinoline quinone biosynthesis protein PqqB n=1 Tax=Paenibacillus sp. XY044 TaxID=2026089 RepID=UPI000B997EB5|nr:pyrroloquinoline quinone biosynthesis protein PqqB [Paenibacillus sp. XY044]OZB90393.1 pyrroloquinoline quinone biosynthesis protein PqqB [Paenibacillus sp. XY044]
MLLKVLGSAAGGGFPQWNCGCPNCRRVRKQDPSLHARMHNSLAVSDEGNDWVLVNATPDIGAQIEAHAELAPGSRIRHTPISAVLLTDGELDHTMGLLHLRESSEIDVYAAAPVLDALKEAFPVRQILEPYAAYRWLEVKPQESFPLFGGRVMVYPFFLGSKPPRYASAQRSSQRNEPPAVPWVVGYRFVDRRTGGTAVYAPGVESWSNELHTQLEAADCVLVDGTFWHSDELRQLGISGLTAPDMGHVPIAGPDGSLERLSQISAGRKIYIHINNTNPILDEDSAESRKLRELRIEVGYDGLELEV